MMFTRFALVAALAFAGAAQSQTMIGGGKNLAFPIFINQPGSYMLSGNLNVPPGVEGIVINAADVTLDLNGYTIQGPNKCSPIPGGPGVVCTLAQSGAHGIDAALDGVVVRNGTVRGFAGHGVNLNAGSRAEALTVTENAGSGLHIRAGSVANGIVGRLNGLYGLSAIQSVVAEAALAQNGYAGVRLYGASLLRSATLINNTGCAVSGDGQSGYRDLVMVSSGGAYVCGAVSLGGNLCGGVPC